MSGPDLHCERCSSAIASEDLRCSICNLACPAPDDDERVVTEIEILRCSGCGAAMTYEVSKLAAACAFCGSVLETERPPDPVEEADSVLPFTVDRTQAEATFRSWLDGLGWFRPGDLRSRAQIETIRPLRWVAWVFDAGADVTWAADTDHGAGRAAWAPCSGATTLEYDDVIVPATRGLTRDEVGRLTPSYDLSTAVAIEDDPDPATVERFDIPRSAARARLVEEVERLARQRLARRHLPGRQVRNLHTATVLEALATRRVAFPAWVLAYRYRKRLYRTVLSGQDATCFKGEAPLSIGRIAAVAAAALTALLIPVLLLSLV